MSKKVIIMPLTQARQNFTSLWKKIYQEDIVIIVTVKWKPIFKMEKFDTLIIDDNAIIKNDDINKEKKINKQKNTPKKWGWFKNLNWWIDWDNIL